ncbi:MAG: efflux RND transporter periplasmic adaptor subunit [Ignavibacteriota bacterium]
MKKILTRILTLAILATGGWYGYRWYQQLPSRQEQLATAKVQRGDVTIRAYTRGELHAVRSVSLVAPNLNGTVQVTGLAPMGSLAHEKDLIIEYDDSELLASLDQDKMALEQTDQQIKGAKANLGVTDSQDALSLLKQRYAVRTAELQVQKNPVIDAIDGKKNVLSLEQAKRAVTQLETDVAMRKAQNDSILAVLNEQRNRNLLDIKRDQLRIEQTRALADISGLVSIRQNRAGNFNFGQVMPDIREGDTLQPGMQVADILDLSEVEVWAKVGELDRANLVENQEALLQLDSVPDKQFHGKVRSLSGTATADVYSGDPSKKFDVVFSVDMRGLLSGLGMKSAEVDRVMAMAESNARKQAPGGGPLGNFQLTPQVGGGTPAPGTPAAAGMPARGTPAGAPSGRGGPGGLPRGGRAPGSSSADLLAMMTSGGSHFTPYFRFWEFDMYAQDNWKVSRRLTIDYGLRFVHMVPTYTVVRGGTVGGEGNWALYSVDLKKYNKSKAPVINTGTSTVNGYDPGFIEANPLATLQNLGMICDPCAGVDPGFSPSKSFVEPRFGIAYDLTGDGKTALRGGVALFHERLRQNNFSFGAGGQFPNLFPGTVYNQNVATFSMTGVGTASSPTQPPAMTIWPTDNTMPSIYSWYVGVQRELPAKFALDLSYSGSRSVHLMDQRNVNALPAGYLLNNNLSSSVNGWTSALLPYAGWGNLQAIETLGYSRYNAMMFRVSRRFADNLAANFNYTWSHVMDTGDNDSDWINNPFCIRCSYANAGYNQPNVISLDFVYTLPKVRGSLDNRFSRQVLNGWELSGMIRHQSGMPFNVTSNGGLYGLNIGNNGGQFPDLVGDPYNSSGGSLWLSHTAFVRPPDGAWGSLGRNSVHLPGISNVDAALMKSFAVTPERVKLTVRFEVFNLFNHPQLWAVNTGFSADNPGKGWLRQQDSSDSLPPTATAIRALFS